MKLSTLAVIVWAAPSTAGPSTLPAVIPCDGDFNSGVYLGADIAEAIWQSGGSSCSNIWGYEDAVDAYIDENYPTDTSDWRTNSCNQGVEAGAEQVVDKYENQCLNESPDECYDLGQVAAQQIAYDFCPINVGYSSDSSDEPNYKAQCKDVAQSICEGAIYGYVQANGCSISTSQLAKLQDKCEDQIESMVGEDDDDSIDIKREEKAAKIVSFNKSVKTSITSNTESCQDFNTGVYHGAAVAEYIWDEMGGSCSNIWGYEDAVDDYVDEHYPTDTSNWRTNSCNQGVEAGADQVVDKYERECLEESPDECYDLGNVAAQMIAYDYCPINVGYSSDASDEPDYKASCRSVAYGVCEGAIYGYVRQNGCSISTSALDDLQDECEDQIDSMTGGEESVLSNLLRKKVHAVASHLRTN